FLGLVTAWRLAGAPTSTSPSFENATMDGVVRSPSEFSMTRVLVPSMTATHELVVPRSIPMILLMFQLLKGLRSKDRRILNTNWGLAAFSQVGAAKGRDRISMPQRPRSRKGKRQVSAPGRSYDSFATATSAGRSSRPFST